MVFIYSTQTKGSSTLNWVDKQLQHVDAECNYVFYMSGYVTEVEMNVFAGGLGQ